MRRRIFPFLAALPILLVATLAAGQPTFSAGPAAADAERAQVLVWLNGGMINIGQVSNCNVWNFSPRLAAYTGFTLVPPNFYPAVGELFYTHLVLGHPGNPCVGSAVAIELLLPPGVELAISANNPVFCFMYDPIYNLLRNLAADTGYGCPQNLPPGLEGLALLAPLGGVGAGLWGMHFQFELEFLVPLRATTPQPGSQNISWRVNPDIAEVGYPSTGLYVTNEVIFRSAFENNLLSLDLCYMHSNATGC